MISVDAARAVTAAGTGSPAAFYAGLAAYIIVALILTVSVVLAVRALLSKRNSDEANSLEPPVYPSDRDSSL